jgi:hypothetical protein
MREGGGRRERWGKLGNGSWGNAEKVGECGGTWGNVGERGGTWEKEGEGC